MTQRRKANRPLWVEKLAPECKCHSRHDPNHRFFGKDFSEILGFAGIEFHCRRIMREMDSLSKPLREEIHAIGKRAKVFRAPPSLMVNGPPKPQARGNAPLIKRGQRLALRLGIKSAKIIELHHELSLEDLGL